MSSTQPPVEIQDDQLNQREFIPKLYVTLGIIVSLILVVLFILGVVWVARTYPATVEALRDVMIIALALVSCIFGKVEEKRINEGYQNLRV